MDVGTATSQNLYNYQTASAGVSRAQAVFQTLTRAYSQSSTALGTTDGLAVLAGQANLKPLISAIYTQGKALQASGETVPADSGDGISGLQASTQFGNLDSGAASSLLTQLFGSNASAYDGFGLGISSASTLATVGADARKAYGSGNLTSEAQAQAAASLKEADGSGSASAQLTYGVQASLSAQLAAMNNTFTLLA